MFTFRHASRASQGGRAYQEDAAAVWPGQGSLVPRGALPAGADLVAVLADGMGGHAAGDVASTLVCGMFLEAFGTEDSSEESITDRLTRALEAANSAIRRKTEKNPALSGMGATLVALALSGSGRAEWISVGDSPLYIWRGGDMVRLNQDHSLAPLLDQMVADGKMTFAQAQSDPRRHYLRSAVTGEDLDLVDIADTPLPLHPGDVLIAASDGLLTLEEDEIRRITSAYAPEGPGAVADALLRAVDAEGVAHQDNTTVIVVQAAAED